ncbi:MAG: aminoacyl-histidine dipeptidase [Bacteroidia bacterium]|nr:aminoacyl-histidine dipeptidase [Bacteroidales bacterium]NCD41787.1 aminoacyl-histidine dipeptidase [Bacteroidia bacterium]
MSEEIKKLKPTALWEHFYALTQIPRPSKHEGKAIDYMKAFGNQLGLETIADEVGNVIIRKPASKGMENRKGVILQAHIDMVPQKNNDVPHDFTRDPIDAYVEGEWVTARGTTLGADNGIGVAAAMAVLADKNLVHGPLEALITMDEETGMTGASNLKPGMLHGDILINMDSEDEGELYVGCAGGIDGNFEFTFTPESVPSGKKAFKLAVTGLKGGHSGMDINLGRGNANKILFRYLYHGLEHFGLRLAGIDAGSLRNAIPRDAYATILIADGREEELKKCVADFEAVVQHELSRTEPGLKVEVSPVEMPGFVMDAPTAEKLIYAVCGCPNGVIRMSDSMQGTVETSTNLAIIKTINNHKVVVNCLLRSSVDSAKKDLSTMMGSVFLLAGAQVSFTGEYPGWKPNPDSDILKVMQGVYQEKYGKIPEIKAIHAGLECGLLGAVYTHWDMISFGPTIRYPHSPDEKVHIGTVQKFWDFLVETLKNIPVK